MELSAFTFATPLRTLTAGFFHWVLICKYLSFTFTHNSCMLNTTFYCSPQM